MNTALEPKVDKAPTARHNIHELEGLVNMNTREAATKLGLTVFDTALPVQWYQDVFDHTGFWPQMYGFVWCYDVQRSWGEPIPLTVPAHILLDCYERLLGLSRLAKDSAAVIEMLRGRS